MVGKRCELMQLAVICVQSQQSGAAGSVKGDFPCVCEQPTCYTEFSSFTICRISCVTFLFNQERGTFFRQASECISIAAMVFASIKEYKLMY